MAEKIVVQLEVDAKAGNAQVAALESTVSKAGDATKEVGANIFDLNKKLDEMSGGAITGFKNIVSGVQSGVKSMGAFRVALAATGIGLLITAAAALVEYFTNFEKPLRVVDSVMNGIGGAINAIVENFGKLLAGDFIGFFTSVGEATIDAVDATNALYDAQERIFEVQKRTIVQNATLRAQLEEGQKIAADTTLSLEERLRGQEAVNRSSEQLIQNERELVQAELARLEAELAISNNYKERRDLEIQIEQTTANLISVEAELGRQRLDAAKAEREIIRQDQANKDAASKEETERIKAMQEARNAAILQIEDALRTANEREIFTTREKYNNLISLAQKFGQDTVDLERMRREALQALGPQEIDPLAQALERSRQEIEIEQQTQFEKLKIQAQAGLQQSQATKKNLEVQRQLAMQEAEARLGIAANLTGQISQLLGQQTAAGKAAAVASATISTYAGAAKAIEIYGPTPIGFAALGSAVLTGLLQVKNILATRVPGGGGASISGGSIGAPAAPAIGSSIGLINPNEQGGAIGDNLVQGLTQRPIRAFVTATDVVSGIDLENRVRANGQFE